MVYFRDFSWLPVHGYNVFHAYIETNARKRDDVSWGLQLRCTAAGPEWRRVLDWERPSIWLDLSSFKTDLRDWRDLERLNFWTTEDTQEEDDDFLAAPAGWLDLMFYRKSDGDPENTTLNDFLWRVAKREGGVFTVELAAFADGRNVLAELSAQEMKVTAEGRTERAEPDAEFWKKNSELYLIEEIPFGLVNVRVPRNVKAPEAFAMRRAQELIGVGTPEHINIRDHMKASQRHQRECPESISTDIFVELHFNGHYEE